MQTEEKSLIENLFYRLKRAELNSGIRDLEAEKLIQNTLKIQPNASYYMTQTILIQEAAIKKLNFQIKKLENYISTQKEKLESKKNSSSFLSNIFGLKKNKLPKNDQQITQNKEFREKNYDQISSINPRSSDIGVRSVGNSFLGNALQTAAGVAGGVVMANMLMNLFHHEKPEEEIFDTINNVSEEQQIDSNENNSPSQGYFINEEETLPFNDSDVNDSFEYNDIDSSNFDDTNDDNYI